MSGNIDGKRTVAENFIPRLIVNWTKGEARTLLERGPCARQAKMASLIAVIEPYTRTASAEDIDARLLKAIAAERQRARRYERRFRA